MTEIGINELVEATGGTLLLGEEEAVISHISLDSREQRDSSLFVPIIGERVDGHRFLCQAIGNGAAAVFTSEHHSKEEVQSWVMSQEASEELKHKALTAVWIGVEDTKAALQALGGYCRRRLSIPFVGITGSVGKTTTREMVAAALGAGFEVYKTPGNSNSQVGVPITMAQIPSDAQIAVIELGMSEPGEMERIARVARVDCGVMTNIGVTHIEQLGTQENILREKLCIQEGMAEDGVLFLNGDDPLLSKVVPEKGRRRILYGTGENCDYRAENLHLEQGFPVFEAVHEKTRVCVRLRVMGSHMVGNALAALGVADFFGVPMEAAAKALEQFEGYAGRQQIFESRGVTVIDDSYNASPVSMKAGLEVLSSMKGAGRRIAVLADMKELGPDTVTFHRQVGEYMGTCPIDQALLLGDLAAEIGEGAAQSSSHILCMRVKDLSHLKEWLGEHLRSGDMVLFKGSNSMNLREAVDCLR